MNLTERLHDLVADEPPYLLDPDVALAGARSRRRSVRAATTAFVGAGAAAAVAAVVLLQPAGTAGTATLVVPAASTAPSYGPLEQLVRQHSASGWTYDVHQEDATGIDADVDDGAGAGRFGLWLSPPKGSIQQHPCTDESPA